jgi:hypothetical protein
LYNFAHLSAVVIKVQYPEAIKCEVVHYNYDGVFGTRTIVEESFIFKLSDQNVFVHDYSQKTARCESLRALLSYIEWDRFVTLAGSKSGLRVMLSYLTTWEINKS